MTLETLDDITNKSIQNNASLNITGMLLGMENKYMQYLEGKEEDVKKLYTKIEHDDRHHDVKLWIQGHAEVRIFNDWAMGSWLMSNDDLIQISTLNDLKAFLRNPENEGHSSKRFMALMNELLKTWITHEPERALRQKKQVED